MVFPLDYNFVFGDNFFLADITTPIKKNTHQQTKLLIQRKHHSIYDDVFMPHLPPFLGKSRKKYY